MLRKNLIVVFCLAFFLLPTLPTYSAGKLGVCRNFNLDITECPYSQISFPGFRRSDGHVDFGYKVDQGDIGEINASNATAAVTEVLTLWAEQGDILFTNLGSLYTDIDETNYNPILNPSRRLGYSPMIWDEDGAILDDLFGIGAKNFILGFAGGVFYRQREGLVRSILESQALLNGFLFDSANGTPNGASFLADFKSTLLHEFAHMFGLDHTQGGSIENYNESLTVNGIDLTDVPIMFPIAANPLVELQRDDIASVKAAYPRSDNNIFGSIRGFLLNNNSPLLGANVVAFNVDAINPRKESVASPTDAVANGRGVFVLPNLVPGDYILRAEPIDENFIEGSSIGINLPLDPSDMTSGFYMGEGNSILEDTNLTNGLAAATRISVEAGSTSHITFDVGNNPSAGATGSSGIARSFVIKGPSVNRTIVLKNSRNSVRRLRINRSRKGRRRLQLSTNYPDLVRFSPRDTIRIGGERSYTIRVVFASFEDFVAEFPDIVNSGVIIRLTVTDLDTGYIDNSQSFFLI